MSLSGSSVAVRAATRTWPDCQAAMRTIIGHLASLGASQEEILACLRRDFPDLPVAEGPAWRRDAVYQNVLATELMRLAKRPALRQQPDVPDATAEGAAPDPARMQVAEQVLDALHGQGAGARRRGARVQVYRLDAATTHRLPDDLKAAVEEYAAEIWDLVGDGTAPRPAPQPPAMSPGLVAFAQACGYVCAYCERPGSDAADPDGRAWYRDHVPTAGSANPFVLACTACRARPDRHAGLGKVDDDDL